MVESLVSSQDVDYLESHKFISIDQSAYLKRHSTHTSLHKVIDDWLEQINDNSLTGACLLDVSKCFDSINHDKKSAMKSVMIIGYRSKMQLQSLNLHQFSVNLESNKI